MSDSAIAYREPVIVNEVIAGSLQSFLAAAALHLGETTADGRTLTERDPQEAWRALLAANALVRQMEPIIHESFTASLAYLAERLAAEYPDVEFPVPAPLVAGV